ncbi:MAG: SDR family NAD(P)-dependent oxidoreductase [Flavobacterium sp.]
MKQYALITGASQGLGKSFALELAKRKVNTILVSLPDQNLHALNREIIEKYEVDSSYFETDLSSIENVLLLAKVINENFNVSILINNAGLGGTKMFTEADSNYINSIIQVNVMATSLLTHQILPNLLKQSKGYILNVSSMAAFSPIGYKTVYPASKAFIHSFTLGLNEELKNTSVSVSVVNPGALNTGKEAEERIRKLGVFGRLTLVKTEKVAKNSITKLLNRDAVILLNPFSWLVLRLLPVWIKLPLITRGVKREIEYDKNFYNRD